MIELLIKAVLSYLLGSVIGSLILRPLAGGVDIRTVGSGNAGATNAMRALGKKVAVVVLLIDLAKGWIATALIAPWAIPGMTPAPEWQAWNVTACGIAVMLGHVYPCWYGFRGGKGFATLVGAVLGIGGWPFLHMLLVWLAVVIITGYVGLASILSACGLAVAIAVSHISPHTPLMTFGVLAALLVAFTHRSNIARMRAGTESRAKRIWLFGLRKGAP
jgi:acyl phosphate:glycerol-3-phosphate acyltransferase